jgi:putative membrane protein
VSVVVVCAIAAALFVQAFVRLRRRRPELARLWRAGCFAAGIVVLVVALLVLHEPSEENLAVHMTQHVLAGDLAPALLVLATTGPFALFLLPPRILGPLARSPLRSLLSFLLRPRVTFAVWAATIGLWHLPAAYDATLGHEALHYLEHFSWTVVGLLAWTVLLDVRRSAGTRVALAAAMFAAGQVLADVLMFTFHPIYWRYPDLDQQHLAGLVMMFEQLLTLAPLVVVLLRPRFRAVTA